jgi:uncharacterized protein YjbJ (UPF0337 family)
VIAPGAAEGGTIPALAGYRFKSHDPVAATWRTIMGEYIDKAKGAANEAIGKAKVVVGQEADSPALVIEGAQQQAKGKAQKIVGAAKGLMGDKF